MRLRKLRNFASRLSRRIWAGLYGSPHAPIAFYLGLVGFSALLSGDHTLTPTSMHNALPSWLMIAWTVGIAIGGLLAAAGVFADHSYLESSGLALLAWGALLYGAVLVIKVPGLSASAPAALALAVATMCLIRLKLLATSRKADEVAGQIVADRKADNE